MNSEHEKEKKNDPHTAAIHDQRGTAKIVYESDAQTIMQHVIKLIEDINEWKHVRKHRK